MEEQGIDLLSKARVCTQAGVSVFALFFGVPNRTPYMLHLESAVHWVIFSLSDDRAWNGECLIMKVDFIAIHWKQRLGSPLTEPEVPTSPLTFLQAASLPERHLPPGGPQPVQLHTLAVRRWAPRLAQVRGVCAQSVSRNGWTMVCDQVSIIQ